MRVRMPYGADMLEAELPAGATLDTLNIAETPALEDPVAAMRAGLERPIGLGRPCLADFRAGDRVCIVVSDSFRYTGIELLLPALLEALAAAGIRDEDLDFLFSTGTHRGPSADEARAILGPSVYERFHARAYTHDAFDEGGLVELGTTARGTRVRINRRLIAADRVILTGTVVMHYFGGFGGGRKSVAPGCAGADTIAQNHARNLHAAEDRLDPAVRIGVLDGNPVAEDMLEASRFCRVDCIVNTVLNRHGEIAGVYCGEMDAAHRAACAFARGLYAAPIARKADLVIASAGKARNFIQSHKALFNAYQAVRPDGRIVFLAPAGEGYGGNKFRDWVSLGSPAAIIAELRKRAEINGQTALSAVQKAPITHFVTELPEPEVALLGGRKAASLQAAIDAACAEIGLARPHAYAMPSASYTVPMP